MADSSRPQLRITGSAKKTKSRSKDLLFFQTVFPHQLSWIEPPLGNWKRLSKRRWLIADVTYLQRKEDEQQAEQRANVHGRAGDIVELAPPRKVSSLDPVLEHEADRYPGRIIYARRWRHICYSVECNGGADVRVPAVGPLALPPPNWNREEDTDDDGEHLRVVDRVLAELATWSEKTPGEIVLIFTREREFP